ncbi:hypothetical protein A3Q56_06056, partial [Intoshia linei]
MSILTALRFLSAGVTSQVFKRFKLEKKKKEKRKRKLESFFFE